MRAVKSWLAAHAFVVDSCDETELTVWIRVSPHAIRAESLRLLSLLSLEHIRVSPAGHPGVMIDAGYCPATDTATIALVGVDDAHLSDPDALRPVEFRFDVDGHAYTVVGQCRAVPFRFDPHGAQRLSDGTTVDPVSLVLLIVDAGCSAQLQAAAVAAIGGET